MQESYIWWSVCAEQMQFWNSLIVCAFWFLEVHVTENPLTKRPGLASRCYQESIWNIEQINRKKIMKVNEPDNTHTPSKAKVRTQTFKIPNL